MKLLPLLFAPPLLSFVSPLSSLFLLLPFLWTSPGPVLALALVLELVPALSPEFSPPTQRKDQQLQLFKMGKKD
jgi:hypothetical protein